MAYRAARRALLDEDPSHRRSRRCGGRGEDAAVAAKRSPELNRWIRSGARARTCRRQRAVRDDRGPGAGSSGTCKPVGSRGVAYLRRPLDDFWLRNVLSKKSCGDGLETPGFAPYLQAVSLEPANLTRGMQGVRCLTTGLRYRTSLSENSTSVDRACPACGRMMYVCDHRYRHLHTSTARWSDLQLNHCPIPSAPDTPRPAVPSWRSPSPHLTGRSAGTSSAGSGIDAVPATWRSP